MARLGRLFGTLTKRDGTPAIAATVDPRRQGATVTSNQSGTSPFAITVDDPGGIRTSDTVQVDGVGTGYNVSAIAAGAVTLNGFAGTLVLTSGQRLIPSNNKPTLYSDRQAVNVLSPLTTNDFGDYAAYLDGGEYDLVASGGGFGTRVFRDVYVASPRMVFNIFDSATAKAFIISVKNALTAVGAKMFSLQNPDTSEVFSVDKDGAISIAIDTPQLVDGAVTTAKIEDLNVTTGKLADGAVTYEKIAANAVTKTFTGIGTTDQAVTAAAYPTWTDVTNAAVSLSGANDLVATDEVEVEACVTFVKTGAIGNTFIGSIRNAAGTVLRESRITDASATANTFQHVTVIYRVTGLTGAQTFKLSVNALTSNGTVRSSTDPASAATVRVTVHRR